MKPERHPMGAFARFPGPGADLPAGPAVGLTYTAGAPLAEAQQEVDALRAQIRMLEGFALDHGHEKCARVIEAARAWRDATPGEITYKTADDLLIDALDALDGEGAR